MGLISRVSSRTYRKFFIKMAKSKKRGDKIHKPNTLVKSINDAKFGATRKNTSKQTKETKATKLKLKMKEKMKSLNLVDEVLTAKIFKSAKQQRDQETKQLEDNIPSNNNDTTFLNSYQSNTNTTIEQNDDSQPDINPTINQQDSKQIDLFMT